MDLTIVIVNWNSKDYLRDCLASLRKYLKDVKITVVDNDSKDKSREMVRKEFPEVNLINSGSNLGFGKANNIGVREIQTKYIMFLNPDTLIIDDHSIEYLINILESNHKIGMTGPLMQNPDHSVQYFGPQWNLNPWNMLKQILFVTETTVLKFPRQFKIHDPFKSGYVNKLCGGCVVVRKKIIDKIGCFDERFFMYCEDIDLGKRIQKDGWKLYYFSKAKIIHTGHGATENAYNSFSTLMMCESIAKYMKKYYGILGEFSYRYVVLVASFIRLSAILCLLAPLHKLKRKYKKDRYFNSIFKYKTMISWSLYREKPKIK